MIVRLKALLDATEIVSNGTVIHVSARFGVACSDGGEKPSVEEVLKKVIPPQARASATPASKVSTGRCIVDWPIG